jgi:hypothetical protein
LTLSKNKKNQIDISVRKSAETLNHKQQEQFIEASILIETELNENMDQLFNDYRNEVAPFVLGSIPLNPGRGNEIIESTAVDIKRLLQEVAKSLSNIGNAGVKVLMCDTIKQGIKILQKSSINQDILMRRVLGGKEQ